MPRSNLPQFLTRNLGWLAASLALALVIWVAAKMEQNPVEQRELRGLEVQPVLADGFIITEQPTVDEITAIVRTDANEWDILSTDDIDIVADMSSERAPGEYRVELEADLPSTLHARVVALRPSTLQYRIDRVAEVRLPIDVVVTNDPPLGYVYPADLVCEDTEVVVRGSEERLQTIDRVEARINLRDSLNPVTKTVNLVAVQDNGLGVPRDIELIPSVVDCLVNVQPSEDIIQMPVLPRVQQNSSPPPGYDFKGFSAVEPDTVGVTGNRRAIQNMGGTVRTTGIDLTGRTESFSVEVPVVLPDGVSLVPENTLIRVQVVIDLQLSTRQYEDVPVEVTGLDTTQFRATGLAETVTVFVSAPPDQLPPRDDVRVVVDLSDLPPGNHQIQPQGAVIGIDDSTVMSISVQPDQLSVTIEARNPTPTPQPTGTPPDTG